MFNIYRQYIGKIQQNILQSSCPEKILPGLPSQKHIKPYNVPYNLRMTGLVDPGCRSSSDGGGAGAHDPGGSGACSQGDHPEQGEVPGLPGSEFGMAIWVC